MYSGLLMFSSMYFNCFIRSINLISSKNSNCKKTATLKFDHQMFDEVAGSLSRPEPDLSKEKDHVQVGNAISTKYECYVHNFLLKRGFM